MKQRMAERLINKGVTTTK